MNKYLLSFLILILSVALYGQRLRGLVLDQITGLPIDYASVFFGGTFAGTTTDENGYFELDVSKYRSRPLTVSAIGYYPADLTEFTPGEIQQVLLEPRIFEIEEVSITGRSLVRKRKACMRIFKREFIGLTSNARKCYILNEGDITFNFDSDQDTLKAYALKPIRIQNLSLGYEITYFLDRFEYQRHSKTVLYTGSIIFNKDLADNEENLKRYERRRAYAYTGSSKHFFRALWSSSLRSSGIVVKNYRTSDELKYGQIVFQDLQGRKFLQYSGELVINYYDQLSYIYFIEEKVYFERDGWFDPTAIAWTGTMSRQRIADFLPYEYIYGE